MHRIENIQPKFKKYDILTSEALNLIGKNFCKYIENEYINCEDGIITGFEIECIGDEIILTQGIIKLNSKIFVMSENVSLKLPESEGRYHLVASLSIKEDKNVLSFDYILDADLKDEFIIFSIIKRENASINKLNQVFDEYRSEYNTIDITNQRYLCKYSKYSTINPVLLRNWANKAIKKNLQDIDRSIILLIDSVFVSKKTLIYYINLKLNLSLDINIKNEQIIKCLSRILNELEELKTDDKNERNSFYIK